MTRIVRTHYRYKPPPRKRKTAPLAGPVVVTPRRKPTPVPADTKKPEPCKVKPCNDNRPEPEHLPTAGKKSAIATARRPGKRLADVPDMTPEEHQRRGAAADALWRKLVHQVSGKERP